MRRMNPSTDTVILIPLASIEALPDALFVSLSSYSRDLTITVDMNDETGESTVRVVGDADEDGWIMARWAEVPGARLAAL